MQSEYRIGASTPVTDEDDDRLTKALVAQERAQRQARQAQREVRALTKRAAGYAELIDTLREVYANAPPIKVKTPRVYASTKTVVTPVLLLSDLHAGALYDRTATGGLGVMNMELFAQRIERLAEEVATITKQLRAARTVNRLVICWGGDNIEGRNIFAGQVRESAPLLEQFRAGTEIVARVLIAPLAGKYSEIRQVSTHGNHGRLGGKHDGLDPIGDSLDVLWMDMLRLRCAGMTNLQWDDTQGSCKLFQLHNWTFLLSHGDKNKGAAHTPVTGARTRRRDYESMAHSKIDVYLSGHLHSAGLSMDGHSYQVTNGSVPGTSPFGASLGFASPPIQTLITVSDDCPLRSQHLIQLATREQCLNIPTIQIA